MPASGGLVRVFPKWAWTSFVFVAPADQRYSERMTLR